MNTEKNEQNGEQKTTANHSSHGLSSYTSILNEICQELNIRIDWLSNGWVARLEKNEQCRHIVGYKFDINSAASLLVADDKFATFEALNTKNIPIIHHALLYEENNSAEFAKNYNSMQYVKGFLQQNANRIVIKPNNGNCGIGVYQVTNTSQLPTVLKQVFHQSYSASMCPFYEIRHEYRLIMLDGEARLAYVKERGEDWRFNLKQGARAVAIEDEELYNKLLEIAKIVSATINLRFCSVDIIETEEHELLVMEVNAGVMTEGYIKQHPEDYGKIKRIYRDAVEKMFVDSSKELGGSIKLC